MSKLNLEKLVKVSASASEVIQAIAGNHEDISKNDTTKMTGLWDDLNDRHAPPDVVKAMADELINLRMFNQMLREQRIADRRRFTKPAPQELLSLVSETPNNEK